MRKLNQRKIRWIIREIERGRRITEIAGIQGVMRVRVWQLYREYLDKGEIPELKKAGRKRAEISREEREFVIEQHKLHRLGPVALEKKIERIYGIHIPHNRIYRILVEEGKIMRSKKKSRQRKYVRFEREHSMSLWQGDWKQLDDGRWWLAFMNDASRRIMCYGIFDKATTENAIAVLKKGFEEFGKPDEILTDHGTQFVASRKDKKGYAKHKFGAFLEENGIRHILARVHHPQTNGKIERFFGLLEAKKSLFNSVDKFIHWYNYDKPHMSLDFDNAETPEEAFWRKLPPERIFEYAGWLIEV